MSVRWITTLACCCLLGCGQNKTGNDTAAQSAAMPTESEVATMPQPAANVMTERVKAGVGVGKKGRSLDQFDSGVQKMVAQPARSFFATSEKMVFNVQIPQALQLFKALEGRTPNSHEEFMEKIIRANQIRLPELPEGQEYEFDTETGELMVVRPSSSVQ